MASLWDIPISTCPSICCTAKACAISGPTIVEAHCSTSSIVQFCISGLLLDLFLVRRVPEVVRRLRGSVFSFSLLFSFDGGSDFLCFRLALLVDKVSIFSPSELHPFSFISSLLLPILLLRRVRLRIPSKTPWEAKYCQQGATVNVHFLLVFFRRSNKRSDGFLRKTYRRLGPPWVIQAEDNELRVYTITSWAHP